MSGKELDKIEKNSIGIKGLQKSMMKAHYVWDLQGRLTESYEALVNAPDGSKCILTRYAYDGLTVNVTDWREESAIWQEAWTLAAGFPVL